MNRISFQWRITLMTAVLIAGACICLNLLLYRSGATGMDNLNGYVLQYQQNDDENLMIEIPDDQMSDFLIQFSQEVYDAKAVFGRKGWCITAAVTLLSAAIAYFVSGKALEPLKKLAQQAERIDQDSLVEVRLEENTDQVSRLASLVRTLLEMSDLQSIPREDHIELAPLADEIVADLTPLAQRRSITLFQECEDVSIKGSDTLIYRLLFNLVENGIKYNTPGGSVHITIRQKKSSAVLRVADTGCGIPEEYRTSVFQPFFRVDKSRSREMGGVGLGLALVREIALLHGGTVTAEPADGHGTVFTVTLPIQA